MIKHIELLSPPYPDYCVKELINYLMVKKREVYEISKIVDIYLKSHQEVLVLVPRFHVLDAKASIIILSGVHGTDYSRAFGIYKSTDEVFNKTISEKDEYGVLCSMKRIPSIE